MKAVTATGGGPGVPPRAGAPEGLRKEKGGPRSREGGGISAELGEVQLGKMRKFWRWMVVMTAEHREGTECSRTPCLTTVGGGGGIHVLYILPPPPKTHPEAFSRSPWDSADSQPSGFAVLANLVETSGWPWLTMHKPSPHTRTGNCVEPRLRYPRPLGAPR